MKFILLIFALTMVGCVAPTIQTDQMLRAPPPDLAKQREVPGVPFIKQSRNYCGPSTLAMAMNWAGNPVTVEQLGEEVFTPKMKGALPADMISASRRHGMMAVPIEGLDSLLHEVDAGHPVIIFENLKFNWYTQWHYAVVFGYDLNAHTVTMHSGPKAYKHWDMAVFERSWEYSDYWGLVVLPPGQLAVSADELAHLNAAFGLEKVAQLEAAEKVYLSILTRWPQSLGALIALGNINFARKDIKAATHYLELATRYHPESIAAQNNLAVAKKYAKSGT